MQVLLAFFRNISPPSSGLKILWHHNPKDHSCEDDNVIFSPSCDLPKLLASSLVMESF
jgi:hypothetical protein